MTPTTLLVSSYEKPNPYCLNKHMKIIGSSIRTVPSNLVLGLIGSRSSTNQKAAAPHLSLYFPASSPKDLPLRKVALSGKMASSFQTSPIRLATPEDFHWPSLGHVPYP